MEEICFWLEMMLKVQDKHFSEEAGPIIERISLRGIERALGTLTEAEIATVKACFKLD